MSVIDYAGERLSPLAKQSLGKDAGFRVAPHNIEAEQALRRHPHQQRRL